MASKLACLRARPARGFALIGIMAVTVGTVIQAGLAYLSCVPCTVRANRAASASGRARGFTLVELVVTIAIVAILVTLAAPSFRSTIQSARTSIEVNSLVNDLQFARSEAIKRGQPVSICVSSDGATCLANSSSNNKWQVGWIVFNDVNGSGGLDSASDVVVRKRAAFTGGDTFVASPTATVLTYNREGFATGLTSGTVTMTLHTVPVNQQATRCVAVNIVGHQVVQNAGTGSCS
ncbi:Tfp pilus assembly protein FimT/FimU [Ralstonia solanacearum]|uniref:Type II secretion system protein H n=3 Tax=Ralstonia solanacearum TaxID=305 RepID=F6G9X9_RALS8|nr:Tfp pilus assembly protein FimT/FimU [Ralstonia solanacearum]AEG71347.1 type-4 fimbrial pilin related protein [Ralstonia solanacearum Po82]AMP72030.1 type II secretion system protein GspH [Ralstonia solanacearum]AMP76030.1 type II secretion system protein GspH [Ralstonia solanacearum]MBB6589193.1 GspH/FimT family pseudopilin [Ralstonia solanacearum]MCG3575377.1 Tfp pilus assembly protein FimT/FimU [Ralstonia solanacearum]